jgi:asparagine N-glycosylation enzyme membrane subunit Stt3
MASAFDTHLIFSNNIVIASSIFTQAASFILAVLAIILGARVCISVRKYGAKDIIGLLALTLLTMPAFIIGSLQGFLRNQGIFYRTERNILQAIPDSTAA